MSTKEGAPPIDQDPIAIHFANHMEVDSIDPACRMCRVALEKLYKAIMAEPVRYCASCGEREGSEYAKHCCTDDNMLED